MRYAKEDILLIKPDFRDIAVMPPLGLGYLASVLKANNFSCFILDNTLQGFNDKQLAKIIRDFSPRIVGFSVVTHTARRALEIAHLIKGINCDILIVFGGPHPSATAVETLTNESVDVVVMGEGEGTFLEIAESFFVYNRDFSGIKGCAFKNKEGRVIVNSPRLWIKDLDALPFPAFDEMPLEQYFKMRRRFGILQKKTRNLPIIASRGCPSKCTFCQRFLGEMFRVRSPENIVNEISYWQKKYDVSEFNFLDDNMTFHKKSVIKMCELLHRRNLNIAFRFPNGVREDFLDEEILEALKSAGCYHLDFGIESGSQKILNLMKKQKNINKIAEKVILSKRKGFKLSASFLFGYPGETIENMKETINFALSLPLDSASFGLVFPFPGTELREYVKKNGYLAYKGYNFSNSNPPILTPDWTAEDLKHMLILAKKKYFFRLKKIISFFPFVMTNLRDIKYYLNIHSCSNVE